MSKQNDIEGLILLLDVSTSMSSKIGSSTYLQSCVDIIQMIVQRKMFQSSKDQIALILYGTVDTANELWDGSSDHYRHVTIARPLSLIDWQMLEFVQNEIGVSTLQGDVLDALIVASNHFHEDTNQNKNFKDKRIILLTDFSSGIDDQDKVKQLSKCLAKDSIRVDIINPFNDHQDQDSNDVNKENGHASSNSSNDPETKTMSKSQLETHEVLSKISETTDGAVFSFNEALKFLSMYQAKQIKSSGTKYTMTIGDSLKLPIVSVIKCKEYKPELFRFKKVYAKDETVELKQDRARFTKDDEQRDLDDKTDVVNAYKYGSSFIPIDGDDCKLKTEKCFSVLGFTKSENVKRHYYLGDQLNQILPVSEGGEDVEEAFVNMVHSMYLEDVYGIVRRVFSVRSTPELGALIPYITNEITCLIYMPLPFDDDIRKFTLENFNLNKKFKPSDKQLNLIDDLIDSMDLTKKKNNEEDNDDDDDDDDDEEEEPYDPHTTFNPYIQRMFQAIALRATNPNSEMPDFEQHITNTHLAQIGEKIRNKRTLSLLDRCVEEFPIKIDEKKLKKKTENIFHDKKANDENTDDNAGGDDAVKDEAGDQVTKESTQQPTGKDVNNKSAEQDDLEDLMNLM